MKLLDYIRGLRKGKEAHRLEKESMADPFLADAMDGYHQVKGNHEQQIRKLQTQVSAYSAKKKNSYAITWSVAACLVIGIGISSYFLFLKKNIGEDVFIVKENSFLTTQKSDSDSVHITTNSPTDKKDKIAKVKQVSKPDSPPVAMTPVWEESSIAEELGKEVTAITVADTSISEYNLKEKKEARLMVQTHPVIKGKITDKEGKPIIGANITYGANDLNKEYQTGTITNLEGEFSLFKKKGDGELTVNYIGFDPVTIPIDTNQVMLIAMNESRSQLNEVVVVGYGTQKKRKITGAVLTVSRDALKVSSDTLRDSLIPEPVIGMKQYKKYLKKNLIRPDDTYAKAKGKVLLTFFVDREGRPFDIKVKKSLCESSDKEAIRLIQEGPDWTYGAQSIEITVNF